MKIVNKRLRVCHFPQIPCKPFIVDVSGEIEASKIYQTLADQHLWLLENNIIPDYSNAIVVEMWDDELEADENGSKWTDYYNDEEFMEFDEFESTYILPELKLNE